MNFKHDRHSDRIFRRFGLQIYSLTIVFVILITPEYAYWIESLIAALCNIPAVKSLFEASSFPAKIAMWIVASIALYPIFHFSMRARVYDKTLATASMRKFAAAVLFMDTVLLAALLSDGYSESMRRVGGTAFRLLTQSLMGIASIGVAISIVYAMAVFATILLMQTINSTKEN